MKARPIKSRVNAVKKRKLRGKYQRMCMEHIERFEKFIEEGYEAYEIKFEPNERETLQKMYDSFRNILTRKNPQKRPIKPVRSLKSMRIWLFLWTEEDEKAAKAEGISFE